MLYPRPTTAPVCGECGLLQRGDGGGGGGGDGGGGGGGGGGHVASSSAITVTGPGFAAAARPGFATAAASGVVAGALGGGGLARAASLAEETVSGAEAASPDGALSGAGWSVLMGGELAALGAFAEHE